MFEKIPIFPLSTDVPIFIKVILICNVIAIIALWSYLVIEWLRQNRSSSFKSVAGYIICAFSWLLLDIVLLPLYWTFGNLCARMLIGFVIFVLGSPFWMLSGHHMADVVFFEIPKLYSCSFFQFVFLLSSIGSSVLASMFSLGGLAKEVWDE